MTRFARVLGIDIGARHEFSVSAQNDVGPAASHVRRNGDRALATRLRDDERFLLVQLGVQDAVGDVLLAEHRSHDFGLLDADGAHQDRLPALVTVLNLRHHRAELPALVLVNQILVVDAPHGPIGRHHVDGKLVDLVEFLGLGVGGTGHARQLLVEAEEILVADGSECLVLFLNLDSLLGLDGLMQAVRPATPRHLSAGELIHDDHLAVFDQVVDVTLVQRVST